jgi:hypothetical protein
MMASAERPKHVGVIIGQILSPHGRHFIPLSPTIMHSD